MAIVIDFCKRPSVGEPGLMTDAYKRDEWALPDEVRKGDTGVMYAAGRRRCYLGTMTIESVPAAPAEVVAEWKLLPHPVPAALVQDALGIAPPKSSCVLDEPDGSRLLAFLRRRRPPVELTAIEGITTESRRTS